MSILEHFTKFSPNSVNFHCSAKSSNPGLTGFDIAACASHMDEPVYHFANWYVNQDNTSRQILKRYLLRSTQQMALQEDWHSKADHELLERFCEAVLVEWENPDHCKGCKGSGYTIVEVCSKCAGSGKKPLTRKMLASLCGVSHGNWRKTWSEKYIAIYSLVLAYQQKAEKSLANSLRGKPTNHLVD